MAFKKYTSGVVSVIHHNLVCSCDSDEHQLNFRFFLEDEAPTLYCTMHLSNSGNIFKRIWIAIKYIFGHKSKYGEFHEVILNPEKVKELKEVIESFEKVYPIKI